MASPSRPRRRRARGSTISMQMPWSQSPRQAHGGSRSGGTHVHRHDGHPTWSDVRAVHEGDDPRRNVEQAKRWDVDAPTSQFPHQNPLSATRRRDRAPGRRFPPSARSAWRDICRHVQPSARARRSPACREMGIGATTAATLFACESPSGELPPAVARAGHRWDWCWPSDHDRPDCGGPATEVCTRGGEALGERFQ